MLEHICIMYDVADEFVQSSFLTTNWKTTVVEYVTAILEYIWT